jgi:predicted transcriptional regulator of viral defense system
LTQNRNKMNFETFRSTFQAYPIISGVEIEKLYPDFNPKNLVYWQKKQYVQRIRNSWYRLKEAPLDSDTLFFISNHIYQPSYISLETAMSYYGFIPEGVFKVTAVSTLKTNTFQTLIGNFGYQNIKPSLYFGYDLMPFGNFYFKIATPEKTILDFLYLHPEMSNEGHFYELRLNLQEIKRSVDWNTLREYSQIFHSKTLTKRVELFLKFIQNN